MAEAISRDDLSLHTVSHRLAMSPRALQRRLSDEGTSWREEVESVRHEHARSLLREADPDTAAAAMRTHIRRAQDRLLPVLSV